MTAQIAATFLIVAGIASLLRAAIPAAATAAAGAFMLFLNDEVYSFAATLASYLPYLAVDAPAAGGNPTVDILATIGAVAVSGATAGSVFALWRVAASADYRTRLIRFYLLLLTTAGVVLLWLVQRGTIPGSTWWAGPLWSAAAFGAAMLTFHRRRWSTPKFSVAKVKDNRKHRGARHA